jgi:hypothetical protein
MNSCSHVGTETHAPTRGCIISPDNGPATKTNDIDDFERPRDMRYGEADVDNMRIGAPMVKSRNKKLTITHFYAPEDLHTKATDC